MKELKQWPAMPASVRSTPPSKNSEVRSWWPGPSILLEVSHGVLIRPFVPLVRLLVVAQAVSRALVVLQSTPWATGVVPSDPPAPPFHRYTSTVDTEPPLVKDETMRRS